MAERRAQGEANAVETWYSRDREWEGVGEITNLWRKLVAKKIQKFFLQAVSFFNICDFFFNLMINL